MKSSCDGVVLSAGRPGHKPSCDAESLGLESYGRVEIGGVEWVCYYDGAYRHVCTADSYDKSYDMSFEESSDYYTKWCDQVDFAEDDIAIHVGRELDLEYVTSAMGTCSRLDCFDAEDE